VDWLRNDHRLFRRFKQVRKTEDVREAVKADLGFDPLIDAAVGCPRSTAW